MSKKTKKINRYAFNLARNSWTILIVVGLIERVDWFSPRVLFCFGVIPLALSYLAAWCRYKEEENYNGK